MRVVIIGAGAIAYRHAEACRDLADAELVAVCDVNRAAADALADRFGVSGRYTDLEMLLPTERPIWQLSPPGVRFTPRWSSTWLVQDANAWGDDPQNVATATQLEIVDNQRRREIEEFPPTDQFWLQLQHMRDCVESGTPHRIPPADSIAQMRVIDAVYASLKTGMPAHV